MVLRETCREYYERRLREGWSARPVKGSDFLVLLSPPGGGFTRFLDLRHDVLTLRPNAAGDLTEWSTQYPSSGSHYDKVDESSPDDDSTYIQHPSSSGSSAYQIRLTIKENGVTTSDSQNLTSSYANYSKQWTTRPSDGNPFTVADIDALQIGVRHYYAVSKYDLFNLPASGLSTETINSITVYGRGKYLTGIYTRITQEYVEVDYSSSITYERTFSDGIGVGESLLKTTGRSLSDGLGVGDGLLKSVSRVLSDGIGVAEDWAGYKAIVQIFVDAIGVADNLARTISRTISDGVGVGESLAKSLSRILADGVGVAESLVKTVGKAFSDGLGVADGLARTISKVFSDGIGVAEDIWTVFVHKATRISSWIRNLPAVRNIEKLR